jgi:hypothetical protein
VVKQLPAEMLLQCSSVSSCMQHGLSWRSTGTRYQHSTPFVLNGLTQFF